MHLRTDPDQSENEMASIRRTLSPARHAYSHQNGNSPFNSSSPLSVASHAKQHLPSFSSASPSTGYLDRLLAAAPFPHRRSKALGGGGSFGRSLHRCLLFFVLGCLLGIFPFGHEQDRDLRGQDFSLEINPSHVDVNHSLVIDDVPINALRLGEDRKQLPEEPSRFDFAPRKLLIVVTPTYNRASQAYFLTRLGQVLRLVQPPLLWIVVESGVASVETAELLRKNRVMYRHLVCSKNTADVKDRGVHQRNVALEHIEKHELDGIVYFADDDNVYTLDLFERLREISRFGTWPVAMLAQSKNKAILEGPVCNGTQVMGWHTNEKSKRLRRFHVDMSGFAFNSTILWDRKRWQRPFKNPIRQLDSVKEGFQETTFIEQVVEDESQMEGVPSGCYMTLNWHLHLDFGRAKYPQGWLLQENLDAILPV